MMSLFVAVSFLEQKAALRVLFSIGQRELCSQRERFFIPSRRNTDRITVRTVFLLSFFRFHTDSMIYTRNSSASGLSTTSSLSVWKCDSCIPELSVAGRYIESFHFRQVSFLYFRYMIKRCFYQRRALAYRTDVRESARIIHF